ncbi:MAG: hypothetical protein V9G29_13905 [Burkholderiaceae bacterium]
MLFDATQQILEILKVGDFHVLLVAELLDHLDHAVAADLPGIDRLQGAPARARARGKVDAFGALRMIHRFAP